MNIDNHSKTFHTDRRSSITDRMNRIFNSTHQSNKRISLTDGMNSMECESANVNTDALNSVPMQNDSGMLSKLSMMYRRKLALQSRVSLPTGQILPSLFFNS